MRNRFAAALAVLLWAPASVALAQEDGQTAFNNHCRTCHSLKEGDNRLGPSLAGVVGRKAGSLPGYAYSEALAKSGLTWDEATLDRFIENPDALISGHNMKPYAGLPDPAIRQTIIGHLKAGAAD